MTRFSILSAALLSCAGAASAAGLDKIDRTIAREPTYTSPAPRYALLVFGPRAEARVWMVADGEVLYVDRNANGDLTEEGERVPFSAFRDAGVPPYAEQREARVGDVFEGKLRHEHLSVTQKRVRKDFVPKGRAEEILKAAAKRNGDVVYDLSVSVEIRPRLGDPIRIAGRVRQFAGLDGEGFLQFADTPGKAPVVHFRGPPRMGLHSPQCLKAGPEAGELLTVVGTPGVGKGTFASLAYDGLISPDAKPVAEVRFPPTATGGEPARVRVGLPYRC